MNDMAIVGVMAAAGGCAGLVAWVLMRSAAAVPAEDRRYLDPPPLAFRALWWPIRWLTRGVVAVLPARAQLALGARLRLAGWDYCLSAEQFTAARIVYAALLAALSAWVLATLVPELAGSAMQWLAALAGAAFGAVLPAIWLADRIAARRADTLRQLPFCLDIITLCVEAGLNLQGALAQAVAKGPKGVLRDELQRVLRDIRAGKARAEALRTLAERLQEPAVTQFVGAVVQAEAMGMNLGPVLRAQADQRRSERFLRAEKLAMQAPVKMLLPLIGFIFPCTFIVLFFPIAMKFLHQGV